MPANFPVFVNLKHLRLIIEKALFEETYSLLEPMVTFLKASPFLHKLLRVSTRVLFYALRFLL